MSRLKFAKSQEYDKNKPKAEKFTTDEEQQNDSSSSGLSHYTESVNRVGFF